MALILASGSPRRAELLQQLGVSFRVQAAAIDESPHAAEAAADYVTRLAREKARAGQHTGIVLAADTVVAVDGALLGKPQDARDAASMLELLSGRRHEVLTGVCLRSAAAERLCCVTTAVQFAELPEAAISAYLNTDEPWDKAGSYAIQGLAAAFVTDIQGSYSNVVGLPLAQTWQLLREAGVATRWEAPA